MIAFPLVILSLARIESVFSVLLSLIGLDREGEDEQSSSLFAFKVSCRADRSLDHRREEDLQRLFGVLFLADDVGRHHYFHALL